MIDDQTLLKRLLELSSSTTHSPSSVTHAKILLDHFKSIGAILYAPVNLLQQFEFVTDSFCVLLEVIREVTCRRYREGLDGLDLRKLPLELIDYLNVRLSWLKTEKFLILFLDNEGCLVSVEEQASGTVNHAQIYPREIISSCIELSVKNLVLVHNHPSGNPEPSVADQSFTRHVQNISMALDIIVHDHLIVSHKGWFSFAQRGLLMPMCLKDNSM